jgi:dihydroflavonol-4-reductase
MSQRSSIVHPARPGRRIFAGRADTNSKADLRPGLWHGVRMAFRVVVVGGSGFLGQHIVAELDRRGHTPVILARSPVEQSDHDVLTADVQALTASELAPLLAGSDALVFAAGTDGSHTPVRPASEFFHQGNVEPVRRLLDAARSAGCARIVVCGSYFATIARERPELRLAERHPYIASRLRQAKVALGAAGPGMSVTVLELPFVFGRAQGRDSAFTPVVPWLRSRWPLIAPPGGTAAVSAKGVAEAACGAIENAVTGCIPVTDENLTWHQLFARLAAAAGRPRPVHVLRLPPTLMRTALLAVAVRHRYTEREPGLNPRWLADLLTSELYLDADLCRVELGVTPGGLDDAFRELVG